MILFLLFYRSLQYISGVVNHPLRLNLFREKERDRDEALIIKKKEAYQTTTAYCFGHVSSWFVSGLPPCQVFSWSRRICSRSWSKAAAAGRKMPLKKSSNFPAKEFKGEVSTTPFVPGSGNKMRRRTRVEMNGTTSSSGRLRFFHFFSRFVGQFRYFANNDIGIFRYSTVRMSFMNAWLRGWKELMTIRSFLSVACLTERRDGCEPKLCSEVTVLGRFT